MGNNGTKITAPVSLHADVYPVLGIAPSGAYYDVAEVCRSGKINKWSFKKPTNVAQMQELTDAQIQQVHCGLTFKELPTLKMNCNGLDGATGANNTQDEVLAEVAEWSYFPPLNAYRLTDFEGYNNGALPSDRDWNNYTFTRSELQTVADSNAQVENNSGVSATIENRFKPMEQFSIRLSDGTGHWIGNGTDDMLPLAYAAGNGMISGEYWRIAYAIYISGKWYLIVGRKPLSDMSDTDAKAYFPPDMSTNTRAVYAMLNSGSSSFTMIPCLVRNAEVLNETHPTKGSQGYKMSYVRVNYNSTVIFSMPSGAKSIKLTITSSGEVIPTINGVTVAASTGNAGENSWVLGTINRGYGGTQLDIPIQQAVILTKYTAPTTATSLTFNVRLTYKKYGNDAVQQFPPNSGSTDVKTYTIKNTDRVAVTYGGVTTQYWGLVLTDAELSGLGFTIEDVQIFS